MMVSGLRQSGSVMGWHKAGWRRNWTIPVNVSCRGLRVGKLPALWISWWNWHRYSEWVRIICCLDIRVLVEMTWKSICQGNQTGRKSMYTGCWMLDAVVSNLGVLLNGEWRNADEISLLFNQFTISLLFCVILFIDFYGLLSWEYVIYFILRY